MKPLELRTIKRARIKWMLDNNGTACWEAQVRIGFQWYTLVEMGSNVIPSPATSYWAYDMEAAINLVKRFVRQPFVTRGLFFRTTIDI